MALHQATEKKRPWSAESIIGYVHPVSVTTNRATTHNGVGDRRISVSSEEGLRAIMDSVTASLPTNKPAKKQRQPKGNTDTGAAATLAAPDDTSSHDATLEAFGSAASNFRNVSACNRCRTRKNRCDQNLPACSGCEKAGVRCVGYDPVSKREIPRRSVKYGLVPQGPLLRPTATCSILKAESSSSSPC